MKASRWMKEKILRMSSSERVIIKVGIPALVATIDN